MRISALLEVAAAMHPDRRALTDDRGSLTIGELQRASRSAASLIEEAARGGGPVCSVAVNGRANVIGVFGAAEAGRPFAPLNYRVDDRLLSHYFEVLEPSLIVSDDRYQETVRIAARAPVIESSALSGDAQPGNTVKGSADSNDIAITIFTSGTTSMPKAVVLRHRHLTSYVLETVEAGGSADGSATLVSTPPYHIATAMNTLTSVYAGRRLVLMSDFDPVDWLETAEREKVTHAFLVPTMLFRILEAMEQLDRPAPSALHTLSYGGAPAPLPTVLKALERFPDIDFINAYGLSETSSTLSVLTPEDHQAARMGSQEALHRLSSVGRPLPGVEVTTDESGEILVRGPQVSGEHVGGRRISQSDWFRTGDVGYVEDGYLYVEGRVDDMIIRGGENISPKEVENQLVQYPDVTAAAVVGLPDEEWGQRVAAVIESSGSLDTQELDAWIRQRIPGFKSPDRYLVIGLIPRNDMGKILRSQIKDLLLAPNEDGG